MLINRITDLSGELPSSLNNLNYIFTKAARDVLDLTIEEVFESEYINSVIIAGANSTFEPKNKKIIDVYRNRIKCKKEKWHDFDQFKEGSGRLKEATNYSPVYYYEPAIEAGVSRYLKIEPVPNEDEKVEIFYVSYPTFPNDIDINVVNGLWNNGIASFNYWSRDMEDAFVIKSALEIVKVRYAEMAVDEEDSELTSLTQALLASLNNDWNESTMKLRLETAESREAPNE